MGGAPFVCRGGSGRPPRAVGAAENRLSHAARKKDLIDVGMPRISRRVEPEPKPAAPSGERRKRSRINTGDDLSVGP